MKLAKRVESLTPYLFAEISKKIAAKRAAGVDIVPFGIGDPDVPTPKHILDSLHAAIHDAANHRYPDSEGVPELGKAISDWNERRFEIRFEPMKETLPLIGSKQGIGLLALCFIDPGDIAIVPDPGYPVYEVGTLFAGGMSNKVPCMRENGWLVDLETALMEVIYDIPGRGDLKKCIVSADTILNKQRPLLVTRGGQTTDIDSEPVSESV